MLNGDLADSALASHRDLPSNHVDSLQDFLLEAFALYDGLPPTTREGFIALAKRLIVAGLKEAQEAGATELPTSGASNAVVQGLQVLAAMPNWRIAGPAICYLALIGKEGRSYAQIGKPFRRCRAAVQYLYRQIQKAHPELRARRDKPEIREDCKKRRLGKRKPKFDWTTKTLWNLKNSRRSHPTPPPLLLHG